MNVRYAWLALPLGATGCPFTCPDRSGSGTYYVALDDGGVTDDAACETLCHLGARTGPLYDISKCTALPFDAGVVQVSCTYKIGCIGGRRPEGFSSTTVAVCDEIGAYLARAAALEAASVAAFRILAAELRAHGAPAQLIDRALGAAAEEARHAELTARLARRRGAFAAPPEIAPRPIRTLETLALENAVEGGVREAYGARVAVLQARTAGDAETRAVFAQIAPEELAHAELAAAVDSWAPLSPAARRRVDEARRRARAELLAEIVEPAPSLRAALGLPDATRAAALI
jgi:hypothetical protein